MENEKKFLKPEAEFIYFSEDGIYTDLLQASEPEINNPGGIPLI